MGVINSESSLIEVAATVSAALERAGITATLSGGGAVSIYTANEYQSKDLDFVTAALLADLKPVLASIGFAHSGTPRLAQFAHPLIDWYIEFPPSPLAFGNLQVPQERCAVLELPSGRLRIITPTHSVLDRLAAAIAWKDEQSRDQAIMVAAHNDVDWEEIENWFIGEGETNEEYIKFRDRVRRTIKRGGDKRR